MGPKDLAEACGVQHTVHPALELLARGQMDLLEDLCGQGAKTLGQQPLQDELLAFLTTLSLITT